MKLNKKIASEIVAVFLAGTGMADGKGAPEVKITINDIKVEDTVYTPYYLVQTEQDHQQGSAQKWIRIGVYFTTKGGWIDELDVTQLALLDCDDEGGCLALSESVHYINIEPGDHVVQVYLHPSYVKRYEVDAFKLDSAAVLKIDGKIVAEKETNRRLEKGWSKGAEALNAKGYLLNHSETPFWFINYDFKEIIKSREFPLD
ncbi:hypothetical protein [Pontiella sp.]|uniref:hypothetical protein n=1 Tax=Pontiella sp. TaxID=2837462 RepID=UPI00356148DB